MTLQVDTPKAKDKSQLFARQPVVYYPDSDGQPMAENDPQRRCITDTLFALEQRYREDTNAYVSADLLVYYVEGDAGKSVAPDVLVSLNVPKGDRRNYLLWAEGKAPDVVFEFASGSTWQADLGWKFGLYQGLGIHEYFLFDPQAEYFDPPLQGYQLQGKVYAPLASMQAERGERGLRSDVLDLELWMKPNPVAESRTAIEDEEHAGGRVGTAPYVLRLYDPRSENWLLTPAETAQAQRAAEQEIARLQDELARLQEQRG